MWTGNASTKGPWFARLTLLSLFLLTLLTACGEQWTDVPATFETQAAGTFSDLTATLDPTTATFEFAYSGSGHFHVHLSTTPDMSSDVYVAFGAGDASPIVVLNADQRWDKYTCGATLYWRVVDTTNLVSSDIQQALVCPPNPFTDLAAALNLRLANFVFAYDGANPSFTVETSLRPDMSELLGSTQGTQSPLMVRRPGSEWPGYECGWILYWRVTDGDGRSSEIQQKHVCGSVGFSDEAAVLDVDSATFSFHFRGTPDHFRVDVSTVPDMSSDVYVGFGTGQESPIVVSNPLWDKYTCGATLYWRVRELLNGVVGEIQTATVASCPAVP